MQAQDIEKYLSQLGQELVKLGVDQPIRVLMIGGAYMMLLADAPRSTDDVDIFWLEHEDEETLQQALRALRDAVQLVAQKNGLGLSWLNYLTQLLLYDQVHIPKGRLWIPTAFKRGENKRSFVAGLGGAFPVSRRCVRIGV